MEVQGRASNSPSLAWIRPKSRRAAVQREKGDASASAPPRAVAGKDEDDGGVGVRGRRNGHRSDGGGGQLAGRVSLTSVRHGENNGRCRK